MGIFATRSRRTTATDGPEARRELPERVRAGLPAQFEAVGEALASGLGSARDSAGVGRAEAACAEAGRELARDGASLDEALEGLRLTSLAVIGLEPAYVDIRALSNAWSEATLGYLHQLSCEDPMTGLASLAHVRSRLSELYRGELRERGRVQEAHALVVASLPAGPPGEPQEGGSPGLFLLGPDGSPEVGPDAHLTRTLRMARLGEAARTVFAGPETIGRVGQHRVVVLTDRDELLGRRVALLRRILGSLVNAGDAPRVWIEGLPSTDAGAAQLLDELAR
ncbi:hypothetical protein [Nocardioides speluncae]|uniref:hypothetical protein n=1 Tax=Nocardioides speluncae TaxID=2670337 RepID=UPI000D694D94|nr:hypothetical protein [Nocardioides speluncae]